MGYPFTQEKNNKAIENEIIEQKLLKNNKSTKENINQIIKLIIWSSRHFFFLMKIYKEKYIKYSKQLQ